MDPEKERNIAELLSKGWTYRRIQKKLGVSSKDIAKVNKKIKGQVGKQIETLEYPPKLMEKITKLEAEKKIEKLKLEIEEVQAEREKLISKPALVDELLLTGADSLVDLAELYADPRTGLNQVDRDILQKTLNKAWKRLFMIAKSHRPKLFKPLVEKFIQELEISPEDFFDPEEGWFEEYGITTEDLKKHGLKRARAKENRNS